MRIASSGGNWPALQGFYQDLARKMHAHGVNSLTTGGIACILYELAQSTKDCDIIIPIEKAAVAAEVLSQLKFLGQRCHLTLKYGAPLDVKWLNGGWSSHTYFGETESPLARVDLFGRPPRVQNLTSDENQLYLARGGVAQMKKTRREKDWAYTNLLGLQMLKRGNPEGLLHVTDSKYLLKTAKEISIDANLVKERPLLALVTANSPELERYLKAEKEFWVCLDDLRLKAFEKAWEPYGQELQKHPHLLNLEFREQNQAMIAIASKSLDPAPLESFGWQKMVDHAKQTTSQIFQNLDISFLPSPPAFSGQEDDRNRVEL